MPVIVRVLWGDDREYGRRSHIVNSHVMPHLWQKKHCPQWIYVYGKDNADLLTRAKIKGWKIVLVDPDPYPDGRTFWFQKRPPGFHQRPHPVKGRKPKYLVHPWHNKIRLLLKALEDHGEIIHCDWDVICLVNDPKEAFDVLGDREMTFSMSYYTKQHMMCPEKDTAWERQSMPAGCWIHMKGTEFIQATLDRLLSGKVSGWHDERAMRSEIELRHGSWPDEVTWLREFESPIMMHRAGKTPWKLTLYDGKIARRETPIPFEWKVMFRNCIVKDLHRVFGKKRR